MNNNQPPNTLSLQFFGAAKAVTGSKHLIQTATGQNILLDCGLIQDDSAEVDHQNRFFDFKPAMIDFLFLSHAHIDHSGNIPNLVKQGFKGPIFMTAGTADILRIMLADSAKIQESEVNSKNKKKHSNNKQIQQPLYDMEDVESTFSQIQILPMGKRTNIAKHIDCMFTDAGHILGSACLSLFIQEGKNEKTIFYSGDVGRYNDRILKAPAKFPQADYILLESTYGDRLHDHTLDAEAKLLEIIQQTCIVNKGNLIIPAFSLGRTQEIVYALDCMKTAGKLPALKIFVDSPLATNATKIMRLHPEYFNEDIREYMHSDEDPFGFASLRYVQTVQESKSINDLTEPCIIIAASGMMEAGRIKHHLVNNIANAANTILIVGYCAENTLGAKLLNGAKEVELYHKRFKVSATIAQISSYSAHSDYQELLKFMACQDPAKVKEVYLVHGDLAAQENLQNELMKVGFQNVKIPDRLDRVVLL
jgi:metallo-beta-lactamase family protein